MSGLVAVVLGVGAGIFLYSISPVDWPVVAFVLLVATLFAGAAWLTRRPVYVLAAFFCLSFALGVGRAWVAEGPPPATFLSDVRHRVSYPGVVVADPDLHDATARIEIRVTKSGEVTTVLAIVPRGGSVARVGDRVRATGTLLVPEPFMGDTGRVFRYDKYLEKSGIRFTLNFGSVRVEREAPWYSLPAGLARVKHAFMRGLTETIPEPYASLAGGIVIGGKSGLGDELKQAFVVSGLVQIIVLSGYNVMVVAEWILAALARTRLSRRRATVLAGIALLLFVGIAGFSATAIRAACMACIALYAQATGKSYAASRALLVVVLLMLLWNPLYLVFDPSFDLSVVATAGLIWLAPRIEARLTRITYAFWKNAVATTLAAQLAVLPLLLYMMGNLSIVAIPANVLVAPLVPLAMAASAIAGVAGAVVAPIMPAIGTIVALPAYLLALGITFIAEGAAALPFAAFTLPAFPFVLVLVAYAALIAVAFAKRSSTTPQLRLAKKASI